LYFDDGAGHEHDRFRTRRGYQFYLDTGIEMRGIAEHFQWRENIHVVHTIEYQDLHSPLSGRVLGAGSPHLRGRTRCQSRAGDSA
jgi:hypothetical protein